MKKHSVGQVLFVVLKKEHRVLPVQIVEEITKKTINGETTSYMVRGGLDMKQTMSLNDIDGEVFDSSENLRKALFERAAESLNKIVDAAVMRAKEWYPLTSRSVASDELSLDDIKRNNDVHEVEQVTDDNEDEESPQIQLPDGTIAKVRRIKLPETMRG